nr:MAG TPA: hypothetical protein [Caudoviricetes sp.]
MSEKCVICKEGRTCINGRFCLKLKRYVEYINDRTICEYE